MSCPTKLRALSVCLILILLGKDVTGDFASDCPAICDCKWNSGNKAALCIDKDLTTIPDKLSSDIQYLDLSKNPFYEIVKDAFQSVGLSNLKKLILKNCELQTVHKSGFSNLRIVIELDISKNQIKSLHPDTFVDNEKLRNLFLNDNLLEKLEDGLFRNLLFLQKIEMKNNRIYKIGTKAFENLPHLKILILNSNNLTNLKVEAVNRLGGLSSLVLHENPWKCDCELQVFRDWYIDRKLYTPPTSCAEPSKLYNRLWNELNSTDFACKPMILEPMQGTVVQAIGDNITLTCKVKGNPLPDVNWVQNSRIIEGDSRKHGDHRYIIKHSGLGLTRWINLTITNVKYQDRGEFMCVAKNPGGVEERIISLTVNRAAGGSGASIGSKDSLIVIIVTSLCAILIFLVVLISICCCVCKRKNIKRRDKSDMHSTNGEALIGEGSVIPEMEKSLITTVNPVTKPPRRYDVPTSVVSGGTEMSELNKTLLDNESVFAPNEDESRSLDFADPHPKSSRDALSVSTSSHGEQRTYPPDLLTFPPRGGQASPAASSASTAPDSTRLPPQIQQSPLHSPIYGTNPNLFKTISHSRSQSPFTSPCAPTPTPRIGYVTIPRRPRVPSWASATSYTTVVPPADYVEPVYDNLGLRTTADGSSVLSLNKTGLEQQLSPIMRGRPLPSTPGSYQPALPAMCAPIEEQDQAPSPAPGTPYSATLPRIGSNSLNFHLSPTLSDADRKVGRPREPLLFDQIYDSPRSSHEDHQLPLSNGQIYDTPSANNNTLSRSGKIPPRPPPKPKKKNSTDSNGPLFEDEGEDGTEV